MFDRYGIGTTVWSPLKYGLLSGKYSASSPPEAGTRFAMDQYKVRYGTVRNPDRPRHDAADMNLMLLAVLARVAKQTRLRCLVCAEGLACFGDHDVVSSLCRSYGRSR